MTLAFLVVLSPDRSRSIWDMRIGENMVKGVFDGNNIYEENEQNKDECQWYRKFERDDYKTGKTYGGHIYPIPNIQFVDGTYFYEDINLWLNWGKNAIIITSLEGKKVMKRYAKILFIAGLLKFSEAMATIP